MRLRYSPIAYSTIAYCLTHTNPNMHSSSAGRIHCPEEAWEVRI